jgi:hypothetical protein
MQAESHLRHGFFGRRLKKNKHYASKKFKIQMKSLLLSLFIAKFCGD